MTADQPQFILINTFAVPDNKQAALARLLEEFTEQVTRFMPGFVSATVHRGLDGAHIANYVRWQTKSHFDAMFADRRAREHMQQTQALASSVTPIVYEIVYHRGEALSL